MKPRDYQLDCINATWNEITVDTEQRPATLALMPTGTGKTIVFGHLADRWIKEERGRVLILAHRRELIDQAAAKFHRVSGHRPHIEMADKHASKTSHFNWDFGQVVVGSVATMKGKRLGRWDKNAFSLIITDEAHHATASGYRSIYDHFDKAALVGVTATPDRSDKNPLGKVFGSVAYQMQILDAINRGWLVPIRQKFVHVESIDLSGVASNWKGDDFDESKLDAVMRQDENIHRIARPTFETAGTRPTLVFATSVAHAKAISDVLNSYRQGCSAYVASYMLDNEGNQSNYPEETRTAEIAAFQTGQRQFLVSCGVFLEGFDAPPTALVAMARPTKSRSLYAQALGRGTRPLDGVVDPWPTAEERIDAIAASAKPDMLVMDFVGNSGKHKLVYADEVLFPDVDAATREKARKKAKDQDSADVRETMEQASAEVEQEKQVKVAEIDKLRRRLSKQLLASFTMRDVDPFGNGEATPELNGYKVEVPVSEKQARFVMVLARKLGKHYDFDAVMGMGRNKVRGMIASLQGQLKKREAVA